MWCMVMVEDNRILVSHPITTLQERSDDGKEDDNNGFTFFYHKIYSFLLFEKVTNDYDSDGNEDVDDDVDGCPYDPDA